MQGVFFDSGDVGAADVKVPGDFPLRLFLLPKETETAADHLIFFWKTVQTSWNPVHDGYLLWWNTLPQRPLPVLPLHPED